MVKSMFGFRLINIDLVSKAVAPQPPNFKGGYYNFDISAETNVANEKKYVIQFIKVAIRDEEEINPLATFLIACIFDIENFEEIIRLDANGLYDVPHDLELYLKSASISTVRGLIWSELKGSYLHYAIMPIVDVRTFTPREKNSISDEIKTIQE